MSAFDGVIAVFNTTDENSFLQVKEATKFLTVLRPKPTLLLGLSTSNVSKEKQQEEEEEERGSEGEQISQG